MQVQIKKLPKSQIEIQVEVPTEEWHKYLNLAAKNLAQGLKVSGFRQGQAPRPIVERELGKGRILSEAAELCCRKTYVEVLVEKNIEPLGVPKITVLKMAEGNPFCYKAEVAVLPEVKLPDYKRLAQTTPKKKIKVAVQEVDGAINYLRKSRAKLITLARPAQKGDAVKIDLVLLPIGTGQCPVPPKENQAGEELKDQTLVLGESGPMSDLEKQLIGMSEGEEREIDLVSSPPTSPPPRGKGRKIENNDSLASLIKTSETKGFSPQKVKAKVKMKLVQKIILPEANDAFAQSLGKIKDLADLRKSLQQGIGLEKEAQEQGRWRRAVINHIAQQSQLELPEILINQEQAKMVKEFKISLKAMGIDFKDYLVKLRKTEKELNDSFQPEAQRRAQVGLCLREIAKQEKVKLDPKEIEEEDSKVLSHYSSIAEARKNIDLEALRVYTKGVLENEKVFQLLEKISGLSF